ncbi:MAG: DUF444 family protein [Pseudomonadota bacterium]
MPVTRPDYDSSPRGQTDAARHREKVKEAIRRNLPEIISNEAVITRKNNHLIRVPIRGLKSYRFVHKQAGGLDGGFGSGESKRGKVIGQRRKPDHGQPGKPGDEPGVDYLETEIDIAELVEMILQDLGLPNLNQKEVRETVIPKGWKFDSIEKHGIRPRLDKKRTIKEAIRRTEVLVAQLMHETGRPETDCRYALDLAKGDIIVALSILTTTPVLTEVAAGAAPAFYLDSSDLRYRIMTEEVEYRSNAVILAMMDVSGSMDVMKKYLARSFFFWMLSFLRTIYKHVEIRFIAHTTEARLVDEHEFFHKGESGGTFCYSAYELAGELIESEYSPKRWNIYPFHFSDGEDWEVDHTVRSLKALLEKGVSTFGYGEIQTEYSSSALLEAFRKGLSLKEVRDNGFVFFDGKWSDSPIMGVVVRAKYDLYPALKVFLRPDKKN